MKYWLPIIGIFFLNKKVDKYNSLDKERPDWMEFCAYYQLLSICIFLFIVFSKLFGID